MNIKVYNYDFLLKYLNLSCTWIFIEDIGFLLIVFVKNQLFYNFTLNKNSNLIMKNDIFYVTCLFT